MRVKDKAKFAGTLSAGIFCVILVAIYWGEVFGYPLGAILIGGSLYELAKAKDKAKIKEINSGSILQERPKTKAS